MSFWWDVKETSLKLLEDFLLDFHFLWSNTREDGTQRQSHRGNSNVHQSNDNLQSSFNSVSHFWKLWENSFCKLTLRTRAKTRSKSRRPGVRTQMWTTETRAKTKAQTKAKGTAKIAEKTLYSHSLVWLKRTNDSLQTHSNPWAALGSAKTSSKSSCKGEIRGCF